MDHFGHLMFTPAVRDRQRARGSDGANDRLLERPVPDGLGPDERAFVESRTSFYLGTVSSSGWPYIQHRGGPAGFLQVLGPARLGFADYRGNRQYVSDGNLATDNRVSLFLMDYPRKARLKLLGRAVMRDAADDPDLAARLAVDGQGRVERLVTIDVAAFDWNCPQFITPRLDAREIAATLGPELTRLETRVAELEAELAALRGA
ncbi:MAG: pyridoxamine 5'-phosphate oxidase family protein [Marinibacterium sp.]|nr:pyridoxamine 5'-phosphate oxidase family protein [Marinibacterium sp.]